MYVWLWGCCKSCLEAVARASKLRPAIKCMYEEVGKKQQKVCQALRRVCFCELEWYVQKKVIHDGEGSDERPQERSVLAEEQGREIKEIEKGRVGNYERDTTRRRSFY